MESSSFSDILTKPVQETEQSKSLVGGGGGGWGGGLFSEMVDYCWALGTILELREWEREKRNRKDTFCTDKMYKG